MKCGFYTFLGIEKPRHVDDLGLICVLLFSRRLSYGGWDCAEAIYWCWLAATIVLINNVCSFYVDNVVQIVPINHRTHKGVLQSGTALDGIGTIVNGRSLEAKFVSVDSG